MIVGSPVGDIAMFVVRRLADRHCHCTAYKSGRQQFLYTADEKGEADVDTNHLAEVSGQAERKT